MALGHILARAVGPGIIQFLSERGSHVENYRGHTTPSPGGLIILAGAVGSAVTIQFLWKWFGLDWVFREVPGLVIAVLGFAFLGFLDDTFKSSSPSGFRGHILEFLVHRKITSGLLKMGLGAGFALAAALARNGSWTAAVYDALIIAVYANALNLLDRRPGRAIKAFILGSALGYPALGPGAFGVIGAAIGYARYDLDEKCMLGDTGSNMLGAVLGFTLTGLGVLWKTLALIAGVSMNLLSERVSFTKTIESSALLHAIDMLGRKRT